MGFWLVGAQAVLLRGRVDDFFRVVRGEYSWRRCFDKITNTRQLLLTAFCCMIRIGRWASGLFGWHSLCGWWVGIGVGRSNFKIGWGVGYGIERNDEANFGIGTPDPVCLDPGCFRGRGFIEALREIRSQWELATR